jgi:2-hydroxy-3-oxopropionate reductase
MLYPPVPISFLGIGLMGKPMAMNLIKSGYALTVWNRTLSKAAELMSAGARLAKSPSDAVRHAEAVVNAMGNVTHVGPHGRGQLCKLVNQCIVAVTIGAVAEGLTLAKAGGADAAQVRKAISCGFCESRILALHGQRMIDRNFVPGGFIKNQIKDLKAALEVAAKLGLQLPLTNRVCELFVALAETGKEELDHSALILQIEAVNGLSGN